MEVSTAESIHRYWQTANARDWEAFAALLHEDVVYTIPQTGERVGGRAGYTDFNATFPGDWQVEILRVLAEGDQGVSLTAFRLGAQEQTCITFFEFEDGLIQRIVDYWPEPYEPPARMSKYVERD